MKKLNNRGWSLGVMLALTGILVLAIIIVAIISYNVGIGKGSPKPIYGDQETVE